MNFVQAVVYSSHADDQSVAGLRLPDNLLGDQPQIVLSDYYRQLVEWFLSSFLPATKPSDSVDLIYGIRGYVNSAWPSANQSQVTILTQMIASAATLFYRQERKRVDQEEVIRILERAQFRCEICGFCFPKESLDAVYEGSRKLPKPKAFVDVFKPITARPRHMTVEVDHIRPVSRGGLHLAENLRAVCFYCNRAKWNYIGVFDPSPTPPRAITHPTLGPLHLPKPYFVIRTLSKGKCSICGTTNLEQELTVSPIRVQAHLNPLNLVCTCYGCDPFVNYRYVPKEIMLF